MIYLASPYSDPDPNVREARFRAACRAAAFLMASGRPVYSPIAHGHPITLASEAAIPDEAWIVHGLQILQACRRLVVLRLPGWERSAGVTKEIEAARAWGLPIEYMEAP